MLKTSLQQKDDQISTLNARIRARNRAVRKIVYTMKKIVYLFIIFVD